MTKDIDVKVSTILTDAEKASNLKTLSQVQLLDFLGSMIKKANEEDDILSEANELLLHKLRTEQDQLSLSALIRIIEMKEKNKIEVATPILKILESAVKPQPQDKNSVDHATAQRHTEEERVTQEDYHNAKKALSKVDTLLELLGKTEFNGKETK